jgi:hypothetical protein
MRHALLATLAVSILAACSPRAASPSNVPQTIIASRAVSTPDAASDPNAPVTPSAQDIALANQIAQAGADDGVTRTDAPPAADAAPSGDYLGQPIAERQAQRRLPQAQDSLWRTLATTTIHEDEARGLYSATHSDAVRALVGHVVTISGFVMPLETNAQFHHFILTRYTPVCPFCPPGAPNEVVEVWSSAPITATNDMVRFSGQFSLTADAEKGLFFQLRNAHLATQSASLNTRSS